MVDTWLMLGAFCWDSGSAGKQQFFLDFYLSTPFWRKLSVKQGYKAFSADNVTFKISEKNAEIFFTLQHITSKG